MKLLLVWHCCVCHSAWGCHWWLRWQVGTERLPGATWFQFKLLNSNQPCAVFLVWCWFKCWQNRSAVLLGVGQKKLRLPRRPWAGVCLLSRACIPLWAGAAWEALGLACRLSSGVLEPGRMSMESHRHSGAGGIVCDGYVCERLPSTRVPGSWCNILKYELTKTS